MKSKKTTPRPYIGKVAKRALGPKLLNPGPKAKLPAAGAKSSQKWLQMSLEGFQTKTTKL